jgi:O-antigen/teichoic acid export membrane protein
MGSGGAPDSGDGRDETPLERWDRNLVELLQELRVAQTGVQILFAFLLTLPFAARFGNTNAFERFVYIGSLLSAAAAAAAIIAPVAYHRVLFRRGRKPELVAAAHRLASAGLAFLLLAMVGAILLVTDYLLGLAWSLVLSGVVAAWFVFLWAVLPWRARVEDERRETHP